jgi:hypothetical protein
MDIEQAKEVLKKATKEELRDHAFGDCEITWYIGRSQIASGYFSGSEKEVYVLEAAKTFKGPDADALRLCFAKEVIERNDETGPDEFKLGETMPGLTKYGVHEELVRHNIFENNEEI